MKIRQRFRSFLPVVIDVETSGFDKNKNAMLELAAFVIDYKQEKLDISECFHYHIKPFKHAIIDQSAIAFNGIDIDHPFRFAQSEKEVLSDFFQKINNYLKKSNCTQAILIGHNAHFDLGFVQRGAKRCVLKSPFHQFSTLDTVSLSALVYGQTVLAKSVKKAGIDWDDSQAHSALYDAQKTAELFCKISNGIDFK